MCNNSLIMMTTTTASSVLAGGIIPLTTINRRRGNSIGAGTNSILLARPGYYKINGTITFTAPAAGVVAIKAQRNGTDIVGITASTTITTATTEVRNIAINGIVRVFCNEDLVTLTLVNSGAAITIQNVSLDVEYLD